MGIGITTVPGGVGALSADNDTLSPLPGFHRQGLLAISILGTLSFVSSSGLLLYLSIKLTKWRLQPATTPRRPEEEHGIPNDLSLGLEQKNFGNGPPKPTTIEYVGDGQQQQQTQVKKGAPNQFLILVFNLLLADMHQATAFMLSARWVRTNEITVGTRMCWTQGWFVSIGDLASSCFTVAVAIYTYLVIVQNWRPSYRALYSGIASIWAFVYLMAILGVAITRNGMDRGGLYVRANAWCWVNEDYENYRLWLHYFWMFISLGVTIILYGLIYYHLRPRSSSASQASSGSQQQRRVGRGQSGVQSSSSCPAFLIYPFIYAGCTAPLALGRIMTMTGTYVGITYFLVSGALIASNGWLDVLLFATTRYTVIFDRPVDWEDTGVDTFAFIRTPRTREFGNMIWVQGGANTTTTSNNTASDERGGPRGRRRNGGSGWEMIGKRIGWGRHNPYKGTSRDWVSDGPVSVSQESLRSGRYMTDHGIQMDTVTSVVVEHDKKQTRSRAESTVSGESSDKAGAYSFKT